MTLVAVLVVRRRRKASGAPTAQADGERSVVTKSNPVHDAQTSSDVYSTYYQSDGNGQGSGLYSEQHDDANHTTDSVGGDIQVANQRYSSLQRKSNADHDGNATDAHDYKYASLARGTSADGGAQALRPYYTIEAGTSDGSSHTYGTLSTASAAGPADDPSSSYDTLAKDGQARQLNATYDVLEIRPINTGAEGSINVRAANGELYSIKTDEATPYGGAAGANIHDTLPTVPGKSSAAGIYSQYDIASGAAEDDQQYDYASNASDGDVYGQPYDEPSALAYDAVAVKEPSETSAAVLVTGQDQVTYAVLRDNDAVEEFAL